MEDLLANIADDSIPHKRGSSYSVVQRNPQSIDYSKFEED